MGISVKEKMVRARQLIQEKKYSEAKTILKTIDHPIAREWLVKLDKRLTTENPILRKTNGVDQRILIGIGVAVSAITILALGALIVATIISNPPNQISAPIDVEANTASTPFNLLAITSVSELARATCESLMRQALPSERTDENFQTCLSENETAYASTLSEIRVYAPETPDEDIIYAMLQCITFGTATTTVITDWEWHRLTYIMCSDLYLEYSTGAFDLVNTAWENCAEQEATLGRGNFLWGTSYDTCVRSGISQVTDVDYYPENDR